MNEMSKYLNLVSMSKPRVPLKQRGETRAQATGSYKLCSINYA